MYIACELSPFLAVKFFVIIILQKDEIYDDFKLKLSTL